MTLFLTIVLSIWAAMHSYVFWRLSSIPWISAHLSRRTLILIAFTLWSSYPLARILESRKLDWIGVPLEFLAASWIGCVFLLFAFLMGAEAVTLGGWLFRGQVGAIRTAAIFTAATLFVLGLVQAQRAPVVRDYEVALRGLPPERDGLTLVQISDLHLGTLLGRRWLALRVNQVEGLRPDIVVAVGDIIDGNVGRVEKLLPVLKTLSAPLGVWAVTGNHEYYAGLDRSVQLFENAGFNVLRDASREVVPGLSLAGVDDLTARRDFNTESDPLAKTLKNISTGATLLLSHTPWLAEEAAQAGVGLMLSGHTHNGQIWPFSYLVQLRYPLLGGRHEVNGMPVVVCRGTGTWGPRVRLFWRSEIVRIRLRSVPTPG